MNISEETVQQLVDASRMALDLIQTVPAGMVDPVASGEVQIQLVAAIADATGADPETIMADPRGVRATPQQTPATFRFSEWLAANGGQAGED